MNYLFGAIFSTLFNPFIFFGLILVFAIHSYYTGRKKLVRFLIIETIVYFTVTKIVFPYDGALLWMCIYLFLLGIYLFTTKENPSGGKTVKWVGGIMILFFVAIWILAGLAGGAIIRGTL